MTRRALRLHPGEPPGVPPATLRLVARQREHARDRTWAKLLDEIVALRRELVGLRQDLARFRRPESSP